MEVKLAKDAMLDRAATTQEPPRRLISDTMVGMSDGGLVRLGKRLRPNALGESSTIFLKSRRTSWKSYIRTSKLITSDGSLQEGQDELHGSQFPCGMLDIGPWTAYQEPITS